jgi:hypothetical protein
MQTEFLSPNASMSIRPKNRNFQKRLLQWLGRCMQSARIFATSKQSNLGQAEDGTLSDEAGYELLS